MEAGKAEGHGNIVTSPGRANTEQPREIEGLRAMGTDVSEERRGGDGER